MKTKILTLATFFICSFSSLFAGNPKVVFVKTPSYTIEPRPAPEISHLAPIAPKEATFEEITSGSLPQTIDPVPFQKFAPVTPHEADFDDTSADAVPDNGNLAPSAPLAASFEE